MINKNVYILYPAGYHGTYVKWAIESSDVDSSKITVLNPINKNTTNKFGGAGTAHLNVKIPTHQSFENHQRWMILNRPDCPKIYAINSGTNCKSKTESSIQSITNLLFQDKTGIAIVIHNNNDPAIESYGKINCVTKWPAYMDTVFKSDTSYTAEIKTAAAQFLANGFKTIECANDQKFRNFLVKNAGVLGTQKKINIDDLKHHIDIHANWYAARNYAQPHEVNEETYISNIDNIDQRVFQINCKDIPGAQFLDIFKNIMQSSGISDNWSTKNLQNVHQEYIAAQSNLQWFDSLQRWESTGKLCSYLTSHSVIESEMISYILKKSNILDYTYEDRARWLTFYSDVSGPDWPPAPANDSGIYDLPTWVQDEIKNKFNYQPMVNGIPIQEIDKLDWETMSLVDINAVFQASVDL